jgi:hypothetical protein
VNWVRNLFCGALLAATGLSLADSDRHEPAVTTMEAACGESTALTDSCGSLPEPGGDDERWVCWDEQGYTSCCRAGACCFLYEERWSCG